MDAATNNLRPTEMDTRKRHQQPACYKQSNISAIHFNKSKKQTGFADDNGFAYFVRKQSRKSPMRKHPNFI
ncbi:hypothetical protein A9Z07_06040 [Acinetobacter sp. YK3]|nr:hypothetical protein A9Z07_06040 [Acinetobacter sp. YK3]